MGVWSSKNTMITKAGLNLLSAITGNKKLVLKRAVAGADYVEPDELSSVTDITHGKAEMTFSDFSDNGDGTAWVDVFIENAGVTEAFYHQQIGLYVEDVSGNEVLFLISQATSPDYITTSDIPLMITHRIFIQYRNDSNISIQVDFSGVVTKSVMDAALQKKEDAFKKNTAFNKNFSDAPEDFLTLGKSAVPGGLDLLARADHIHPIGTMLRFAENNWSTAAKTNLIPDTNNWVMSNGKSPQASGDYEFEATFTGVWEGFSCFFSQDMLEKVQGKSIEFGVKYLTGASARLEMIVDGNVVNYILQTSTAASVKVDIPSSVTSITLRIIIFTADDLHCKFEGIYLYDTNEEVNVKDEGEDLFLSIRKVKQANLPSNPVEGTLYITELGNLYLTGDDKKLLPLAGSSALS